MSTATTTTPTAEATSPAATPTATSEVVAGDSIVTLFGIGWEGYETILGMVGERRVPRLIYRNGDLILMSPSLPHESKSDRLGVLVTLVTMELDIPCIPTGSTTFRRRDLDRGLEPDRSFYLANEARVRGNEEIDLTVDPPPDLAIEVEVSRPAAEAVEIYGKLGVPEVWVYNHRKGTLRFLILQEDGTYAESPTSRGLPMLSAPEVLEWVRRPRTVAESTWQREVRDWVRDTIGPRWRAEEAPGQDAGR